MKRRLRLTKAERLALYQAVRHDLDSRYYPGRAEDTLHRLKRKLS